MNVANNTDHSVGHAGGRMLSRLVDMLQSHWKLLLVGLPFIWLLLFFWRHLLLLLRSALLNH